MTIFGQNTIKNTPKGIRIPVTSVKGKCPRPLDDGGSHNSKNVQIYININTENRICQVEKYGKLLPNNLSFFF